MTVFELMQKKIAELRSTREAAVLSGRVEDWAEYKRVVGVIEGLNLVEQEIKDLAKQIEEQENGAG